MSNSGLVNILFFAVLELKLSFTKEKFVKTVAMLMKFVQMILEAKKQ